MAAAASSTEDLTSSQEEVINYGYLSPDRELQHHLNHIILYIVYKKITSPYTRYEIKLDSSHAKKALSIIKKLEPSLHTPEKTFYRLFNREYKRAKKQKNPKKYLKNKMEEEIKKIIELLKENSSSTTESAPASASASSSTEDLLNDIIYDFSKINIGKDEMDELSSLMGTMGISKKEWGGSSDDDDAAADDDDDDDVGHRSRKTRKNTRKNTIRNTRKSSFSRGVKKLKHSKSRKSRPY